MACDCIEKAQAEEGIDITTEEARAHAARTLAAFKSRPICNSFCPVCGVCYEPEGESR